MTRPRFVSSTRRLDCVLAGLVLYLIWSTPTLSAPWDNILKKAEEAVTESVDELFETSEEAKQDVQQVSKEVEEKIEQTSHEVEQDIEETVKQAPDDVEQAATQKTPTQIGEIDAGDCAAILSNPASYPDKAVAGCKFREAAIPAGATVESSSVHDPSRVAQAYCRALGLPPMDNAYCVKQVYIQVEEGKEPYYEYEPTSTSIPATIGNPVKSVGAPAKKTSPELTQSEIDSQLIMKLGRLAPGAGHYAATLDMCGEPGGAEVRADFESLMAPMSESSRNSPRGPWYGFDYRYNKLQRDWRPTPEACASALEGAKESWEAALIAFNETD